MNHCLPATANDDPLLRSISKNDLRIEPVQEVLCTAVTGTTEDLLLRRNRTYDFQLLFLTPAYAARRAGLAKLGEMIEEALKTQQMDNDDLLYVHYRKPCTPKSLLLCLI
jgi:hypothetical protein